LAAHLEAHKECPHRTIVIGPTGTGKSTIVNMLYNHDSSIGSFVAPCNIAPTFASVTSKTHIIANPDQGMSFIDTVGIGDRRFSDEQILESIRGFIKSTDCGVTSIIVTERYGRLSKEMLVNLHMLNEVFEAGW